MISKEMMTALRKAKLADVCLYNGAWMHNDGRQLSAADTERVEKIAKNFHTQPDQKRNPKKK